MHFLTLMFTTDNSHQANTWDQVARVTGTAETGTIEAGE
jgi:hypothetical protein